MDAVNTINTPALIQLNRARKRLTPQQYKTLRGQILAGEAEGALRGLQKILNTENRNERAIKTRDPLLR